MMNGSFVCGRFVLLLGCALIVQGCASVAAEGLPSFRTLVHPVPAEDESVDHLTLLVGSREWKDDTAEAFGVEDQIALGLEFDTYDRATGHGFEVGAANSYEDKTVDGPDVEAELFEIYAGYRKTFLPENDWHPYLSVGLSYIEGELDVGPSDDDTDVAPYARLGVLWSIGETMRIGLDYRHVFGSFDLFGGHADADYDQLALSLGVRF